jgi:ssRNA-specific RNase YbeY (16S rRNA maturation enzyme)
VLLADEDAMAQLNAKYRAVQAPTDILSFSNLDVSRVRESPPGGATQAAQVSQPASVVELRGLSEELFGDEPPSLGDMVLCPAYMERKWGAGESMCGAVVGDCGILVVQS